MEENTEIVVPEGYKKNTKGHLVPLSAIKPIDLDRDVTVEAIFDYATEVEGIMKDLKVSILDTVNQFVERSMSKYNKSWGGNKGNIQLLSYDGETKITVSIQDKIELTEEILAAKVLVEECIKEWSKGADDKIIALINGAFDLDEDNKINPKKVFELKSLNIEHEKWDLAMKAISDSVKIVSSKPMIRVYRRNEEGKYIPLKLDIK